MASPQSGNQPFSGRISKRKRVAPARFRTNEFVGMPAQFSTTSIESANSQQCKGLDDVDKPENPVPALVPKVSCSPGNTEKRDSLNSKNETDTDLPHSNPTLPRKLAWSQPSTAPSKDRRSQRNVKKRLDKFEFFDEQQVSLAEEKRYEIRIRNRALCVLKKAVRKKKQLQDLKAEYEMWQNCKTVWTELDDILRKVAFIKIGDTHNLKKNFKQN